MSSFEISKGWSRVSLSPSSVPHNDSPILGRPALSLTPPTSSHAHVSWAGCKDSKRPAPYWSNGVNKWSLIEVSLQWEEGYKFGKWDPRASFPTFPASPQRLTFGPGSVNPSVLSQTRKTTYSAIFQLKHLEAIWKLKRIFICKTWRLQRAVKAAVRKAVKKPTDGLQGDGSKQNKMHS